MLKALLNRRFVQFGTAGIAGLLVDLAMLYLLAPWLGWYLARAVSFLAAATCTWGLNRRFTFRPAPGTHARLSIGREYITYITSMLGGAAINYTVYVLTLHWMPGAAAPTVGVALGSCVGVISNFTAARMLLSRRPIQERMLPLAQWTAASRGPLLGIFTDIDDTLTTEGAITPTHCRRWPRCAGRPARGANHRAPGGLERALRADLAGGRDRGRERRRGAGAAARRHAAQALPAGPATRAGQLRAHAAGARRASSARCPARARHRQRRPRDRHRHRPQRIHHLPQAQIDAVVQ
jgi:putative flippase GtrA